MNLARFLLLAPSTALVASTTSACPQGPAPTPDAGPPGVTLTVTKSGDGTGTFRTTPDGIDCDTACDTQAADFAPGAEVALRVEPSRNANLIDALCGVTFPDGTTAQRELEDDTIAAIAADDPGGTEVACNAELRLVHSLQVFFSGTGHGAVVGTLTTQPNGQGTPRIQCEPSCQAGYFDGETETLTPIPDPGSVFVRWQIDCAGTSATTVTMDDDKNCEAQFALQ